MKHDSDENLMQRYQNGDTAAFETLYLRHKPALHRYFVRQCSNITLAEELFQDTWMSIIKARLRYVVSAKFTTYMYRIAHNKLVDYYRRNSIRLSEHRHNKDYNNSNDDDDELSINDIPAQMQQQPEHIITTEQKRLQLRNAIKRLPEAQREVFILREEAGFTLDEIANIIQVNKETAKSRLRYAVKFLKKALVGDS